MCNRTFYFYSCRVSGAGKSTLMSALAYRNSRERILFLIKNILKKVNFDNITAGSIIQGDILINGCQIGPFMRRLSGFVHQDDLFYGSLTVLEHLTCMAHLKLDRRVKREEINFIIRDLLERTGLVNCMHTKIGEDGEGKMLSGGEKKRLSFATELLTQPGILFCDEPTTGLDSYNAQKLVETLQDLAERKNTAIMCTIHQPSSQLFAMFDQVLLLSEGRIAFFGSPDDALDFFAENGYKCPASYNPADFLIGVLSTEHGPYERNSQRTSMRICDMFAVSEASQQRDLLVNLEMHMFESGVYRVEDELSSFRPPMGITTMYWLVWRFLLTVFRDPTIQFMRVLQKIGIALMAGLCYMGAIDMSQAGVQAIQGILFIFVSENTFSPMYSVLAVFPSSIPIFLREIKSGIYTTDQYYLANVIAMVRLS
jgi:ATP-binding cassette, subfamily G (WHITE), eye pigment precursor transporter